MTYESILEQYIWATNTHDFDNVKSLLHPEAVYWFSDQKCDSIKAIQNYFENTWNTIKEEVYSASDIRWLVVKENTATCIYTYLYKGYVDYRFVSGSGRATNVFVKDNEGNWKLIHEHLSSI